MSTPGPSYKLETTPHCPCCGHKLDGAFCVDRDASPSDGDWTICIKCAAPLRFGPELTLRAAKAEDVADLNSEEAKQVARAIHAIKALHRKGQNVDR